MIKKKASRKGEFFYVIARSESDVAILIKKDLTQRHKAAKIEKITPSPSLIKRGEKKTLGNFLFFKVPLYSKGDLGGLLPAAYS